jgi:acyl-CoA synthetase (AMP-forming)/AMP-acid ligase II
MRDMYADSCWACNLSRIFHHAWTPIGGCQKGGLYRMRKTIRHCSSLAGFKIPKSIEFVDALPKGGTGKVLKKVLREKYWVGQERRVH